MERVFTTTLGRDPSSKPNDHKRVLTFNKREEAGTLRLVGISTRKRIRSIADAKVLKVDGLEVYLFQMLYGEELVVTVSANRLVTVLVSGQSDFEEWRAEVAKEFEEDDGDSFSYPPYHVAKEEVRAETTLKFYATEDRTFLVCLFNITSKKARVTIELVHWSKNEDSQEEEALWGESGGP
jgi:hypothetical protein